ncbi:MAG: peptidylprolyl isomerase [Burkholderiales bacterium]|nr:peptidylprolyl isomerase [Burkholderiales bacterium]
MSNPIRTLLACLFAVWALPSGIAAEGTKGGPILLDRVLAIVNNEVISKIELDEQVKLATRQLIRQGTPLPQQALLEKQLLERMVTSRVLQQVGRETGVRIEDAQLERAIARLAQDNKMSVEAFRNNMVEDGVDYVKFREEVRNEIVVTRLREREVDSKIVVSDAEIDTYLRTQQASGRNDEYNLLHILFTVPEAASPDQIQARRARADEALGKLKGGADFKQISASYSDAPNALQGGELGWRAAGRLPNIFVQAVTSMKVGEVSGVLRSPNGFHILKLVDKRSNVQQIVVQQTKARHILVRLNEVVAESEAKRRLSEIRERIAKGADFAEQARLQSEDASSVRGGDLGWLSPGDTVPEFEQAMDALKPGEISEPIQTPFGWHLIQVVERRTEDLTKERQRQLARQAIRARKSDEAFTEWVRQQRDRAFVEYRNEER